MTILPNSFENNNGLIGDFYIRQFTVPAGESLGGHYHHIDHLSFLHSGSVSVTITSKTGEVEVVEVHAPNFITVAKDKLHDFTAITDAIWYCIFAEEHGSDLLDTQTFKNGIAEV